MAAFIFPSADKTTSLRADQRFGWWYLTIDRAGAEPLEEEDVEDEDGIPEGVDAEEFMKFRLRLREQCAPASNPKDRQQFFLTLTPVTHDKTPWGVRLTVTSLSRYAMALSRVAGAWAPFAGRTYGGVSLPDCPSGAALATPFAELLANLLAWVMRSLFSSHECLLKRGSKKDILHRESYRGLEHSGALDPWTWHALCREALAGADEGPLHMEWEDVRDGLRLPKAVTITLAPSWVALMAAGFTTRIGHQHPTHFLQLQPPVGAWGHALRGDIIVPHRFVAESLGLTPVMDVQQRLFAPLEEEFLRARVGSRIPTDASEPYAPYEERVLAYALDAFAGGRDGVSLSLIHI